MLCVGYGLTDTAVVLVTDGRWWPVRFDGVDVLSSAVFVGVDGMLVAGAGAWLAGMADPGGLEPAPSRWLPAGQVRLGSGVLVGVWDLVSATLMVVADRVRGLLGGTPVDEVRLVVPAGWGPRRLAGMREAASRAGWGSPELVPAAVGVAAFAGSGDVRLLVGSYVAVCVLDGGVEASVVRRTRDGFEVLSVIEAPDAGGYGWDVIVAGRLVGSVSEGDGWAGNWVPGAAAARAVREALTAAPAAVTVVTGSGPVVVTADVAFRRGVGVV